ncbi:MAG: DUF1211 domain-containing protein [Acidobacteria bacterium]|nr:DUF1211 domain-containing protein [Acidobacteriota bacterium]
MTKTRLEAFSDAVIAIIMTIMVLGLEAPAGADWLALRALTPVFLTYALSFALLAIYWNNHHHLLHATAHVDGAILWANMHLLFWLSLVPFVTAWVGATHFAPVPTAVYGIVQLLSALAYWVLVNTIVAREGPHSALRAAIGRDVKGKVSILIYAAAVALAFANPGIAAALYVVVALMWLVPDRRIETRMTGER